MMKTLSYFMLPNERRMSRMTTTETLDLGFQKGLFVQGFVHVSLLSFTEWNNAKYCLEISYCRKQALNSYHPVQ